MVLVLSLPVVSVAEPSVNATPCWRGSRIVWLKPARASVAPPATVKALNGGERVDSAGLQRADVDPRRARVGALPRQS